MSWEEARKLLKRVQELSQPSPSSSIDSSSCSDSSGFVVKFLFRRRATHLKEENQKDNNELVGNSKVSRTKTINYKNNMKLYKSNLKEKKKTSKSLRVDLTTLIPNSKTNALLQEHGFNLQNSQLTYGSNWFMLMLYLQKLLLQMLTVTLQIKKQFLIMYLGRF